MKKIILLTFVIASATITKAQIYIAKSCEISFFSASPLENIEAINKNTKPIINTATGDVQMKIAITGFVFEKPLMQEHFNENYLESDKFPSAIFKGKINEKIDKEPQKFESLNEGLSKITSDSLENNCFFIS